MIMTDETGKPDERQTAIDLDELNRIAQDAEAEEQPAEELEDLPSAPPTSEMIYPIVSLVTAIAAPNWQIQDAENKALSEAYGDLLDKYFPDVGNSFGVELNALLLTAAIVAPRLGQPRKIEEKPKESVNVEESQAETVNEVMPMMSGGGETVEL